MKQTGRRFDAAAFYGGTNSEAYRYLGAVFFAGEGEWQEEEKTNEPSEV